MAKVNVKSLTSGSLLVKVPALQFQHEWLNEGSVYSIEQSTLEELMFDTGFKYMIDTGMLYIEDMGAKRYLGIEPEDALEPVNVIVLTDKERRKYMVNLSLTDFKEKVAQLNYEQVIMLADYAIANRLVDFEKAKVLKQACGRDIIKSIQLSEANKEE